jgi:hypothetical protein
MHRTSIVVTLMVVATQASAQEDPADLDTRGRGHFGAPVVAGTVFRGQGALMFGGQAGWNVTPTLVLGGAAYATMTEIDGPDVATIARDGPIDLKVETFGVDVGYTPRAVAPTHLTIALFAGGAAAHYVKDKTTEQQDETDFMLLFEPSVGVETRVARGVQLRGAVSYRLVSGVEQPGLRASDMNGPAVSLAVKFGRF